MRILHIPHAYSPVHGGAEHYCKRLSETLAGRGHHVRVVTADLASPEGFYQLGIGSAGKRAESLRGVEVRRLAFRSPAYRAAGLMPSGRAKDWAGRRALLGAVRRFTARLDDAISDFSPDVVMTMPHLFTNVRAVLQIRRRRGFPLVVVPLLHEEDPSWPLEEMAGALAGAQAVVATTAHEAERLRTAYRVAPDRVFTCPGGADLPASRPRPAREPRVLFLGRKVLQKGIPLLLESMRLVWRDHPGLELVLAGARAPSSGDVDALVTGLPPHERRLVRSLDDVTRGEKEDLLAGSACLVLPSRVESFGMVLLEAWAFATPVVALDLPVLRSVVDSGVDGRLVTPDDPVLLAEAISSLVGDPGFARRLGEAGRRKVEDRYTWQQVAAGFETAYAYAAGPGR